VVDLKRVSAQGSSKGSRTPAIPSRLLVLFETIDFPRMGVVADQVSMAFC
jgi:hypothetical protein